MFAGPPSRKYKNKDGKDQYAPYFQAAFDNEGNRDENGAAFFDEMAKAAYAFYQTLGGGGGE